MPGKCIFQESWLERAEFTGWLQAVPGDPYSALCSLESLCHNKRFSVKNLGVTAVTTHASGKKHREGEF